MFATNSDFLIPIYVQPNVFDLRHFKRSNSLSLKYHRFTPSGSKDIGIRKFEFVKRLIPFHSGSRPGTIALPLY